MDKWPTFRRSLFRSLAWQLAIYVVYVAIDATVGTGQFATFYEAIYCWFSRGLLTKLGERLFTDPWSNVGFVMIIGPLVGIVVYSLLIGLAIVVWQKLSTANRPQ